MIHLTKDGEVLDQIAFFFYSWRDGATTAQVLDANPELCTQSQPFVAGIQIYLPNIKTTSIDQVVKLWD